MSGSMSGHLVWWGNSVTTEAKILSKYAGMSLADIIKEFPSVYIAEEQKMII